MAIKLNQCTAMVYEKEVDPAMVGSNWLDPSLPDLGYTGWFYQIKHGEDILGEAGPFRFKEAAAEALDSYKEFLLEINQLEE